MSESNESFLELQVEMELEKLFALQGQNLSKEKKAIWIQELISSRLPMKAILQGIRSIKTEDISKLTFAVLAGATRKFITAVEQFGICDHCHHGFVIMRDSEGHDVALACTCEQGNTKVNHTQWNEKKNQDVRGRILYFR